MKKIIFIGIILFYCLSCNSKSQEDSIQFNVDENLLAEIQEIDTLGFSFAPPLGWKPNDSKVINQSLQKFQNEELNSFFIRIKDVYYDSSSSSFCSISIIQSTDSLDMNYFVENFSSILSKQFKPESLKQGNFTKQGLEITQFLLMTESNILFKLYFQPTKKYIIQIDYAIDRSIYPNYIKKIESSIGSITII